MPRCPILLAALLACLAGTLGEARADHPLEFVPSYYPHQIRIEAVAPAPAAKRLARHALHAYAGGDPFAGRAVPAGLGRLESLGGYLVLTFNAASTAARDRENRCASAGKLIGALVAGSGPYVFHPYPVTPFHPDYLHHFDRAESARQAHAPRAGPGDPVLRVRVKGALAERLAPASWRGAGRAWDATVEEIGIDDLVSGSRISINGWLGPPWIKEGWFHAYLLHAPTLTDGTARQSADAIYRRLTTGTYYGEVERLNLERRLVWLLLGGCDRRVVGYTVKREYFNNTDYSEGVENIAHDSQAGVNSPIFPRTVKLKDFLWNGWLRLGIESKPRAAWNPMGGFTDPMGQLIWFTASDPAMFPAPYSGNWIANRVTPTVAVSPGGVEIPEDALLPEPGTGLLKPVGAGKTARAKVLYRILASPFHDQTVMTAADLLYPFSVAYRWGVKHPRSGNAHDPLIDAATALVREWLAGVKVVGTEQEIRNFGETKYASQVYLVEVYLTRALADPLRVASVAPPWSSLPWELILLMEEAVTRGVAAFSHDEAKRRGVPWLDLVREPKMKDRLAGLVEEFRRRDYAPPALKNLVAPGEATARWASLKRFYAKHRHFLVTNGPYRLLRWSADLVVLDAFRDPAYPVGLASFNQYPVPRRAYVSGVEVLGDRLDIHADVERFARVQRSYTITREPLPSQGSEAGDLPVCRYVVVDSAGDILSAGTAPYSGAFSIALKDFEPGLYTILVALYLGENSVNPEVKLIRHRLDGAP